MNTINKTRVTMFAKLGVFLEKIDKIPDNMYNRLRYKYHNKLPASFYLLFNVPKEDELIDYLLFTTVLPENKDYQIIYSSTKVFGDYLYIECEDKIYDIKTGTVTDKEYYKKMFGVTPKYTLPKEEIISYINSHRIAKDSIEDCQDIDMNILDSIDEQYKNYNGKRKDLIERQIKSYYNDIHYEDDIIWLKIK